MQTVDLRLDAGATGLLDGTHPPGRGVAGEV
jgi:hypothetical protein